MMVSLNKRSAFGLAAALVILAVLLAACGGGGDGNTPAGPAGDAAKGQTVFAGTCSSCHGPDAKGLPGLGKDLTTSEFVRTQSDVDLVNFIKVGRPASDPANTTGVDMPPKGGNPALTDQDIADVVAYLRTINQ
jgi:disulfide bond formation protein DsbB